MYPTIQQNAVALHPPTAASSSQPGSSYGGHDHLRPLQTNAAGHSGNYAGSGQQPSSPQNCSLLRVQIAQQYRTAPPVMVSTDPSGVPRAEFAYDWSFERQVIADHEAQQQLQARDGAAAPQPEASTDDAYSLACEKYQSLGYDRETIMMALVACGLQPESRQKIVQFCDNYGNLRSMGFRPHLVVGALLLHPDNLQEASEACLNSS